MKESSLNILNRIQLNYKKLSKGQRLIADYIINNYDKVAFMTASKLGEKVGVSESTVVRFATALGYGGYPKLQKELQEFIKTKLTTVQRLELSSDYNDEEDILKKVMKADVENIKKTIEETDAYVFQSVTDIILEAKKVYILGLRSSTVLAEYLGFYLNFILDDVSVVPSGINDVFDQLINIDEKDVIIGISFPRYSKKTLEALKYAKTKRAAIIGITDSNYSPIKEIADFTLTARSNMASFVDSLVAPMSLINALIVGVSMKEKDKITSTFKTLENIWNEYDIYLKNRD
ncbi:transcriptional regulator, RpiR family [Caminicella sporogenes DSM 14501]|uniref:Transcriptional regulator, RpiR family n=1 Tax=Caminicella sporogenes DSM 14501 TaxID=1121266 RepID=A0A1M6L4T1_9FIRM|nr:MurR/RpiR family transcriptional regulator [Caminicella sporogenes]RKD27705.1 N-acetylmannosamine kinase [Caminicella sporogenes]WIF94718.1 MurR/RpiR family transcriptional regulator [Caminicella sporogenes]SHJ66210.1 transcriptional regulator, RpiR family [Caminicella sporogenes DSM 14501]